MSNEHLDKIDNDVDYALESKTKEEKEKEKEHKKSLATQAKPVSNLIL